MAALPQIEIEIPGGVVKTFGKFGPEYEVLGAGQRLAGGKALVTIRVLRTGEMTQYEYDAMMADPEAT